jgi:hypothetical protein
MSGLPEGACFFEVTSTRCMRSLSPLVNAKMTLVVVGRVVCCPGNIGLCPACCGIIRAATNVQRHVNQRREFECIVSVSWNWFSYGVAMEGYELLA